jgi:hypothetical protein
VIEITDSLARSLSRFKRGKQRGRKTHKLPSGRYPTVSTKLIPGGSVHWDNDQINWFVSVSLSSHIFTDYGSQDEAELGRFYEFQLRVWQLRVTCGLYRKRLPTANANPPKSLH